MNGVEMNNEIDNARDPEQLRRMLRHQNQGECHFCPDGFSSHTSPVIYNDEYWFITGNDMPYKGTKHHYLIVSRRHTTSIVDLLGEEFNSLQNAIKWLVEYLEPPGYTIFVRSGNMKYTGATLDHLHFHFVMGIQKKSKDHPMIFGPLGYQG